jgi:signal transduction histidine kinase
MFRSVRSRLWLTYAFLIAIVLGLAGTMVFLVIRNLPSRTTYARLEFVINLPRQAEFDTPLQQRLPQFLRQADNELGVRFLLVNRAGAVLFDTRADSPAIVRLQTPTPAELAGDQQIRGTFLTADNHLWLYVARPLSDEVALLAALPRPAIRQLDILRDDLLPPMIIAGLVMALLALLLAILVSRWISTPIRRMAVAAQAISREEYEQIRLEGPSEVQDLARALNEMTVRVRSSQQSQQDLVANVSHELKTPLTSIQGFSQAILDGTVQHPEGVQQAASVIHAEANRMNQMVLELLDLARLDGGAVEFRRGAVDLGSLMEYILARFQHQAAGSDIDLALKQGDPMTLVGDGERLAQVFSNLVDNAIKHTPTGGRVEVRLAKLGDFAEIFVADTGPGIPESERARIFERFYQLDKSRPGGRGRGIGLGLPIAAEIVQAHGGSISVRSKPGQGTIFVVKLPLVQPDDSTLATRRR